MKLDRSLMARASAAIVAALMVVAPGTAQANPSGGPEASPGHVKTTTDGVPQLPGGGPVKEIAPGVYVGESTQAWACPYTYVCFYPLPNGQGNVCMTDRDEPYFYCGYPVASYFNNGAQCYYCDHVYVYQYPNYNKLVKCIHYGWAQGRGNGAIGLEGPGSVKWGGECPPGTD